MNEYIFSSIIWNPVTNVKKEQNMFMNFSSFSSDMIQLNPCIVLMLGVDDYSHKTSPVLFKHVSCDSFCFLHLSKSTHANCTNTKKNVTQ